MKAIRMIHVSACQCGRGIVHDGRLECDGCREDAFRRSRRQMADIDLNTVRAVPPRSYLSDKQLKAK